MYQFSNNPTWISNFKNILLLDLKRLSVFLFSLLFLNINSSFADYHHYVEGLKIGDSLLDYHSEEELSKLEDWFSFSATYSSLAIAPITNRQNPVLK